VLSSKQPTVSKNCNAKYFHLNKGQLKGEHKDRAIAESEIRFSYESEITALKHKIQILESSVEKRRKSAVIHTETIISESEPKPMKTNSFRIPNRSQSKENRLHSRPPFRPQKCEFSL
jgi:hypothetical protein